MDVVTGIGSVAALLSSARSFIHALRPHRQLNASSKNTAQPFRAELASRLDEAVMNYVQRKDMDGDGLLRPAEFGGSLEAFKRYDADSDGLLSATELKTALSGTAPTRHAERLAARALERYDSDADGTLTAAELGLTQQAFSELDVNHDGELDLADLMQAAAESPRPAFLNP